MQVKVSKPEENWNLMSKKAKILLGIGSILPIIWLPFFILGVIGITLMPNENIMPFLIIILILGHFIAIFTLIGMMVFYVIKVIQNKSMSTENKVFWCLGLFFGTFIAVPIYWYIHIWRGKNSTEQIPAIVS